MRGSCCARWFGKRMDYVSSTSRPTSLGDRYLLLLLGVLLGYAFIGRGFAYLGLPPLYVGEMALLTGFIIFLRTSCLIAALATLPSLLLAAAMAWVMLRTLPFVGGRERRRASTVQRAGTRGRRIALLLAPLTGRVATFPTTKEGMRAFLEKRAASFTGK